ncbi:hypothetical protein [Salibacterium lacus]|uniref:Uncharacterized protein n=1 Tax=Salibacterium lacus TaxID=1898109 RepID=A0ABW5SZC3_9BACI
MSTADVNRFTFALRYRLWLAEEADKYDDILFECERELPAADVDRLTDEILTAHSR